MSTDRAALDAALNRIIQTTTKKVSALGFVRRGFRLRTRGGENSGIIEFQRSRDSSKDKIIFTVNLAVVCGGLLESWEPPLEKAGCWHGHLRERIGMLMPERQDKWWELDSASDEDALTAEVSDLILTEGAPYVKRYVDTNDLIALWKSGRSPGITEKQRVMYLEKLSAGL